jgi:aldose 1-epimerase
MKGDDFLVLERQASRLVLDPGRGGAIRTFSWRSADVFRPTPAGAGADPFDTACFPMVPYVNRVAQGRFEFGAHEVRLERNWSEDPHPLHGQGWRRPWSVVSATATRATLRFEGGADEWPWRYRSEQHVELQPEGLSIELSLENLSDQTMPFMLGLHPYFPQRAQARMEAQLPRVWLTDNEALPQQEVSTPAAWSFIPARPVQTVPLDHGFTRWNGSATLRWPTRTVSIVATGCDCLHVYVPGGGARDFFCVEPQNAAPGALGRGTALQLAPAERTAIRVQFLVGAS